MRKLSLIFLLLLPAIALAQEGQHLSSVGIKITKVAGTVYLLRGSGGNIAASVGDDGILLVDTEYGPLGDKILAALASVAPGKKVRYVIDTHYHPDHTSGNAFFASHGAIIIAQQNVRKRLKDGTPGGNGGSMKFQTPPQPAAALPAITYENQMSIYFNGEEVRVTHFPAAHTDGDSVIYFTKSNVVHMGDIFPRDGLPFSDVVAGGSIQGMIAACDTVASTLPPDAKLIPGHGDLATMQDLRAYIGMMKQTTAAVRKAIGQHKTLAQMKQDKILAPWEKYAGADGFVKPDAYIEELYYSLTAPSAKRLKM